jgi:hypothetical protein
MHKVKKMINGCIVAWAHTPFGKLEDPDVKSLMTQVSRETIVHAKIAKKKIREELLAREDIVSQIKSLKT